MRRILLIVLCLLLAFYVGWPLWSAMQLRSALRAEDAAGVERRIDFPSVRASMKPSVAQKVGETFDAYTKQIGPSGALIATQIKPQVLPKMVDTTLDTLINAQNVIRLANDAGPMKERIERIIRDQLGKLPGLPDASGAISGGGGLPGGLPLPGGLGQIAGQLGLGGARPATQAPAQAPAPAAPTSSAGAKTEFGISNIKSFAFTGPFGFEVGLAKDASATQPDVTAQMGFSGFDWKLTGLVPRL